MAKFRGTDDSELIEGWADDDRIVALGGDDTVDGALYDDRIAGGAGDDLLYGDDGNDTLFGGSGDDTLQGDSPSFYASNKGPDLLTGGAGEDVFDWGLWESMVREHDVVTDFTGAGRKSGDRLSLHLPFLNDRPLVFQGEVSDVPEIGSALRFGGNGFTEVMFAQDGERTLLFADTNDDGVFDTGDFMVEFSGKLDFAGADFAETNFVLRGNDRENRLSGDRDDDSIFGFGGDDTLAGGGGDDVVEGGDGDDEAKGGAGEDWLYGDAGADRLSGGAGRDDLSGGDGQDRLVGGAQSDLLEGAADADRLIGGGGADTFGYHLYLGSESTAAAHDTIVDFRGAGVGGGDELYVSGDVIAFLGEVALDPVIGAALPGAGDGVTQLFYTHRGANTRLIADLNDDGLLDDGDFTIVLKGLHDLTEDDFSIPAFVTAGSPGDDTLRGTGPYDRIHAVGGDDLVFGGRGSDDLYGGAGDDTLSGGGGDSFDELYGEAGDDRLVLSLQSSGSSYGGEGADTLIGGGERLQGGEGDDVLIARGEGAYLLGGAGRDRLVGGAGYDQLRGGDSANGGFDGERDVFVFGTLWGRDFIGGFEDGIDKLDLRGSGLSFSDITIGKDVFGRMTVISSSGEIHLYVEPGEQLNLTESDFLFGP